MIDMVFATMPELLSEARKQGYALGYFEVWNLESTRALVEVAEENRSPLIIGFNGGLIDKIDGLPYYASLAKTAVENSGIPATSLLNEPSSFQQIIRGIRHGFMAVMVDFSSLEYHENVTLTKKVTEICHAIDVSVEAQLDEIPSARDGIFKGGADYSMTDPKKAAEFVRKTGVDALSISVGNVHELYKEKARLDFERIRLLGEKIGVPLVLHGGTGISDDSARKAISLGVCKINLGIELRRGFLKGVEQALSRSPLALTEQVSKSGEEIFKNIVRKKMETYGCKNKA